MTAAERFVDVVASQRPNVDPTATTLRTALLLIEAAAKEGIPAPASVTAHAAGVDMIFNGDDTTGMDAWATWLDEPIEVWPPAEGAAQYSCITQAMGVRLMLLRLEFAPVEAGEPR